MRAQVWAGCVLLLAGFLGGCLGSPPFQGPLTGEPPADLEWSLFSTQSEIMFHLAVRAGPGTICVIDVTASGGHSHPSGLAAFGREWTSDGSNGTMRATWHVPTAHAGPAHASPIVNELVDRLPSSSSWGIHGGTWDAHGSSWYGIFAFTDLFISDDEPLVRVECAGADASIRYYQAIDWLPIHSSTAEGGAGTAGLLIVPGIGVAAVGANRDDRFAIDARGQLTILALADIPSPGKPALSRAQFSITTPVGQETLSYELEGDAWYDHFTWDEQGEYGVAFDRVAVNYSSLTGVLGSLELLAKLPARPNADE